MIGSSPNSGESGSAADAAPPLLKALTGARPARTPVWFMRQAGRSLPEYRAARTHAGTSMLDACLDPDLAAEFTLQPVRRHGVDAAVFFSDIMVPLRLAGLSVRIEPGVGPVFDEPVRTPDDVARLIAHRYAEDAIGQAVVIYAPAGGRMPDDFLSMAHSIGYETVCSSRVGIWRPASRPVPASAPVSQPGSASASAIPASVGQGGAAGQTGRDAASGQSGQGAAAHGHGTAANGPGAAAHDHGAAGGQAEEVPRLAMLHNTAEARFLAWITQHPAEMLKQQLRYRVLRLSKQLLGNGGHERLRALLLRTPRTDDTPKDD